MRGEIKLFCGNTAPSGHLPCDGRQLNVADYPDLFNVIGHSYGGSGAVFNVPDLQGRAPIGSGPGAGLTARARGEIGGAESVTLLSAQMPVHSAGSNSANAAPGAQPVAAPGVVGGSQPHENMPPFAVVHFVIEY